MRNRLKQPNSYVIINDYAIFKTSSGREFIVDAQDANLIKEYYWHISSGGYVCTNVNNIKRVGKNTLVQLHRLIMNPADDKLVDHRDHNKLNNRRLNLRECTYSNNNMNKRTQINNTSGVKGVCWYKKYQKWMSYIKVDKKFINLGYYLDINDAVKIRKEAEHKYFGDFAYREENSVQ